MNVNDIREHISELSLKNIRLKEYANELFSDIEITIMNIREKSLMISSIRSKWMMYYFKEKENLKRLKAKRLEIVNQKMNIDPLKTETLVRQKISDNIAEKDATVKKIDVAIQLNKEIIEFLEYTMNILNDFGFSIKNAVDIMKLEQL